MIVPVTVTASVVLAPCFLPFDSGCANASGASSAQQARMVIVFFILCLLLMVVRDLCYPLQRDSEARAACYFACHVYKARPYPKIRRCLTTLTQFPETIVFVFQALLGGLAIQTQQPEIAYHLANTEIPDAHTNTIQPLVRQVRITGW